MSKVITSKRLNELATELIDSSEAVNHFGYKIGYPLTYSALMRTIDSAYDALKAAEYLMNAMEHSRPEIFDFTDNEE